MKILLLIISVYFLFVQNSFAKKKYVFNPKIERESYYNCGHCPCDEKRKKETNGHCLSGSMECCWPIYIYVYPKNIDKMIKENPEFKEEIMNRIYINKKQYYSLDRNHDEWSKKMDDCVNKNCSKNDFQDCYNRCSESITYVENCYDLWKYDPKDYDTVSIKEKLAFEQHCNKIVKKILKKTGRLY